jgi:hypothetical protein
MREREREEIFFKYPCDHLLYQKNLGEREKVFGR